MEIVGLSKDKIKQISEYKNEDKWILDYRLKSYDLFSSFDMPKFGPEVNLNFDDIVYYKADKRDLEIKNNWTDVLKPIQDEFEGLGVIESEAHMNGMGVQYESEVIYHNMLDEIKKKNVIFT